MPSPRFQFEVLEAEVVIYPFDDYVRPKWWQLPRRFEEAVALRILKRALAARHPGKPIRVETR